MRYLSTTLSALAGILVSQATNRYLQSRSTNRSEVRQPSPAKKERKFPFFIPDLTMTCDKCGYRIVFPPDSSEDFADDITMFDAVQCPSCQDVHQFTDEDIDTLLGEEI